MHVFPQCVRAAILGAVLGILALTAIAAGLTYFFYCPCGIVPGGWLLGTEVADPVTDWSAANDVPLCQIQVSAGLPHSVNLNCMATGRQLYLSCANCAGKRWSTAALADPRARIRIGDKVFPVELRRVVDPDTLNAAWRARARKLGQPLDRPRADGWWSFRVRSRGSSATPGRDR